MEENSFYISLKNSLKNRLIKDLIKDEEFKDLDIEDLIRRTVEKKLNEDIDFNVKKSKISEDNIEKKSIRERLNKTIEINQNNPKRKGTQAYDRYEKYKKATNFKEFLDLGGSNLDYHYNIRDSHLKELD
tara:strand:- start:83 stop:472 length:390 start_codon:yes stop_codon:yes gene_type:complete